MAPVAVVALFILTSVTFAAHCTHPSQISRSYDFVIAGAGPGGLTVANRLSEDPSVSVLVIEYGHIDDREEDFIPFFSNINNLRLAYNVTSVPQKHINNESAYILVGGTVGGGTAINALAHDKGSAADYAAWETLGNPGWGIEDLQPYFEKSTRFTGPSQAIASKYEYSWNPKAWGVAGPVNLTLPPYQWPQLPYFLNATAELGLPIDGTNFSGVGVTWVPATQDSVGQKRVTARTAYYDPVADRPNLDLLTGTQVTKVDMLGKVATGAEVRSRHPNSFCIEIQAKKEVILSVGAIFTPNILHKSGIGPRSMLEAAGIECIHDLPGVGTNLQDAPASYLIFNLTANVHPSLGMLLEYTSEGTFLRDNDFVHQVAEEYRKSRTGPWTKARAQSVAYLSLEAIAPDTKDAMIRLASEQDPSDFLPTSYGPESKAGYALQHSILLDRLNGSESSMFELPFDGGELLANVLQKSLSRGVISLNASDPDGLPVIDFNALSNPVDGLMMVAMLNFTRKLYQTNALALLKPLETSDERILQALKQYMSPTFSRPSGTSAMMPLTLGGVVGPDFRVHGLGNLRIVDASVMPMAPANRIGPIVYAIAEKASDMLKKSHGLAGSAVHTL